MPNVHKVVQGEHLSGIAESAGLPRDKVWDDPSNAGLKSLRKNPNVLLPGDSVVVPDPVPAEFSRPTDVTHKFTVSKDKLDLCMVLVDCYEKPIAKASCLLRLGATSVTVTTDGNGRLQQKIPASLKTASVTIQDPQTPYQGTTIPIKIGKLDPVEEKTGQQARLSNLGYYPGEVGGTDDDAFESAVEEFQCDHNLTVDGDCGPQTQAKLKQVHGC
jgi:N-acetylmuramoyl-L-alanine amidase